MINQTLKLIGLTDGEIKVYLALIELGNSTTWDITKKSKVSGSKVYEVLNRLAEKGLVSFVIKNNVKYFEATSPEKILNYLDERGKEIESEKNEVKKIIPELLLKQKTATKSEVKVFMGFEGAKIVYEDAIQNLKKGDEILGWGLTEQPENWENYFNEREEFRDKKGVVHRTIINEKYKSLYNFRKKLKNTQIRFFPKEMEMPTAIEVWKNKVALFVITKENPITILIESEAVANSFKKYFNLLWDSAKK